ncbi:PfkB family carbohydrate kinase [Amycolatopsis sp. FBCC-B4732]|uniref:PfkB family carbohydrate kinase n=1 Tax=unclassified Amycolatopsis TaxID=2618356 RepID=UPI001FF57238|nr:PfkB family carbohydrate kinase [Amycolatopsis sp. FBCC-B4732]UOX85979.1 PfkB family carbohydrate kinase [Amycolatopsis sp. FBCC-B4732]
MARYDATVEGVRSVFLKLRTRSGLTVERLDATEVDVRLLAELPAVRRRVRETGASEGEAIVDVVTAAVAALDPADLLIADAALALGVLRARVGERPEVERLYADDLGERRRALADGWDALHALVGVSSEYPPPTVRSLRGSIETRTLGVLAERCAHDVEPVVAEPAVDTVGSVVVVGSAVTDHVVVSDELPDVGEAVQAQSFDVHPGGKGLLLAVAGRRLGLDAKLVTAIGGDSQAQDLLQFMRKEGLSTALVKETPGVANPRALVLVSQTGETRYLGWMNKDDVSLSREDLRAPRVRDAMAEADAVLVTLEPPMDTIKWALSSAAAQPRKPLVLLQASPPRGAPQQLYRLLRGVDYLVGREGELRRLLSDPDSPQSLDDLARSLLALGVGAVCVVENFGCSIRSSVISRDIEGPPVPLDDAPGVREAFSAALIQKLIQEGAGRSREEALHWAIAAMATNPTLDEIADSMPGLEEVERTLETDQSLETP